MLTGRCRALVLPQLVDCVTGRHDRRGGCAAVRRVDVYPVAAVARDRPPLLLAGHRLDFYRWPVDTVVLSTDLARNRAVVDFDDPVTGSTGHQVLVVDLGNLPGSGIEGVTHQAATGSRLLGLPDSTVPVVQLEGGHVAAITSIFSTRVTNGR
jgi:hypothetical protein